MKSLVAFVLIINSSLGYAQVKGFGINTIQPKGMLDLSSQDGSNATMALVLPRVERIEQVTYVRDNGIAHGTLVYDMQENCPKVYLQNIQSWSSCLGGKNNVFATSVTGNNEDCFLFNNVNYCIVKSSDGKLWLNKDLEGVAYYQWGRGNDGHQSPSSPIINLNQKPTPFVAPSYNEFIINYGSDKNWINSSFMNHNSLWNATSSPNNNPCPQGWKVPSEADLISLTSHDINQLFGFTMDHRGIRQADKEGTFNYGGYYVWTTTLDQPDMSKAAKISNGTITIVSQRRDSGLRIRCLKQ